MKRLVLALVLSASALAAMALPTVEDVQAELAKGNDAQAEQMMREVVQARPGSARAHYVYAEILARQRHYALAADEAARAKAIDPALQFTQPDKFRAFEQLLQRESTGAARSGPGTPVNPPAVQQPAAAASSSSSGLPGWVWGLGVGALALLAWRALAARRNTAPAWSQGTAPAPSMAGAMAAPGTASAAPPNGAYQPGWGPSNAGPSYAPGAGYPPAARGPGWLGAGLAAAGGVAAGMAAERMLEGGHHGQGLASPSDAPGLRGLAPGLLGGAAADDDAQRELDQRPIDLGNGDEWGGGDAGAADSGPSGSDDGW